MAVSSYDIKSVKCYLIFFIDIVFFVMKEGSRRINLPSTYFMANMMMQILSLCIKLQLFSWYINLSGVATL